ncbi:MAG: quinolinate synthase NadA [Candidatus Altiarchaeota archaeon]|nr:quinolinate synthase NadA [Candidatus Altiarchaeota archaeon]
MKNLIDEILDLKKKRKAIILAHNYERPEIQDIADFVGDSLGLSREAVNTKSEIIVFCGVDFMAETASILNPNKTVLIPDRSAMCPMAMMLEVGDIKAAKEKYPDSETVLYINTTAETKAEADCICTSANAPEIVNAMDSDTILFGPDKNLAYFVEKRTDKKIIPVPRDGVCPTHHQLSKRDFLDSLRRYPDADLLVHPEVIPKVQDMAEHITSTEGMVEYCGKSSAKEFIIGTENGLIHRLEKEIPKKIFYRASDMAVCPVMKMTTLEKVRDSLEGLIYEVKVSEEIRVKAKKAIDHMLEISR